MLVVERTDPSAAVADGVDALQQSGVRRPRIDVPLLQQNQLLAKRHQLGHYADPPVDGLLMQAQQSFDSAQKIELLAQAHDVVVDEAA